MRLVVATRNTGKFKEIKEILNCHSRESGNPCLISLLSLNDFSDLPEVVEDGLTFRDNALKKAKVIAEATKFPVLAEDSGLEIKALDGRPGIYSARFAGEGADGTKNIEKVLRLMRDVPGEKRQARFVTAACLFISGEKNFFTDGICEGSITFEPSGTSGFGYDPIFVPNDYKKTFAELGETVKNHVSHRAMAIREMRKIIVKCASY